MDDARVVRWSSKKKVSHHRFAPVEAALGGGEDRAAVGAADLQENKKNTILRSRTLFCRSDSIIQTIKTSTSVKCVVSDYCEK